MRQVAVLLCVVTLLTFAIPVWAQQSSRSFADAASDTVKDAAAAAWETAQQLSSFALGLIGVDYKYGGTRPETGLDCSGLVRYVFQQVTGVLLPRTAKDMSKLGEHVTLDELKPGDLVFFNTRHFAFSHVGIYLGDNRFVHAPSAGREVEIATLEKNYWQQRFDGARRLVGTLPEFVPAIVAQAVAAPIEAAATSVADLAETMTMP